MIVNQSNRQRLTFVVVLCLITLMACVVVPAGVKYLLYERARAAPKLRNAIGQEVKLRFRSFDGSGNTEVIQGKLMRAGYRLNDKWGLFDLAVYVEGTQIDNGHGGSRTSSIWTGISPSEAVNVEVLSER